MTALTHMYAVRTYTTVCTLFHNKGNMAVISAMESLHDKEFPIRGSTVRDHYAFVEFFTIIFTIALPLAVRHFRGSMKSGTQEIYPPHHPFIFSRW